MLHPKIHLPHDRSAPVSLLTPAQHPLGTEERPLTLYDVLAWNQEPLLLMTTEPAPRPAARRQPAVRRLTRGFEQPARRAV